MSSIIGLNELVALQEFYDIIIDENCQEAILFLEDGSLGLIIPEEYPEEIPNFKPNFPALDNSVILILLTGLAENNTGEEMLKILFDELEFNILPDLKTDRIASVKAREEKEKNQEVQNDRSEIKKAKLDSPKISDDLDDQKLSATRNPKKLKVIQICKYTTNTQIR